MTPDTHTRRRGRPSRQALQHDLRALAALDARDHAFARRLERLIGQASASASASAPRPSHTGAATIPVGARLDAYPARRLGRPGSRRATRRLLWPLAALVALVLAASGRLASVDLANQAAVSAAQAILQRGAVATSHAAPGHVLHLVYQFSAVLAGSGRVSGTLDLWMRADLHGGPPLVAQTQLTVAGGHAVPGVTRRVLHGTSGQEYLSGDNTVRRVLVAPGDAALFVGGPRYVSLLAQGAGQKPRLLPAQLLDGVRVVTVQVASPFAPDYTLYFDARSYLLRGVDIAAGRGGRARLVSASTLLATAAPPDTFTLQAPPTAHASTQVDYVGVLPSVDHPALALVAICGTLPARLTAAMASGTRSPLALCQASDPAMKKGALIAALVAEERARLGLDEGAAAGKMSAAQEAAQLAALRAKLAVWVAQPLTD